MLHRDPAVWGDDAEEFDPDHISAENRARIPPNAYKPFGTGQRACIGRQFALQEATLVLGMLLQRFELVDHADYQLKIEDDADRQAGRVAIRSRRRAPAARRGIAVHRCGDRPPAAGVGRSQRPHRGRGRDGMTPLLVLFGSNLGTAEGIAHGIAEEAPSAASR